MPIIVFENGPDKGQKVDLEPGKIYTGGRDPACELNIKDQLAAGKHFKIREHQGKYYIRDLGTESTVLVNDEATHQAELNYNDKIQVGDTILTYLERAKGDPLLGLTVSGYEFLEHLGRGGMGTVYRARQVSLNRDVAIKRLSPRLTKNAEFRERFIKEARAAGVFNHPNVLQVFDVIHEEDICFYSMEYIPGGTVGDLINAGTVPLDRAVNIIRDATRGLLYAEQKQIMHHDIKPQNLMITDLGSTKISDMGLAGSLEDAAKGGGATLLGTPHFMSPERIQRKELDIRSDIYSLGCTLYMILTGKTPFHGDTVKQILLKHMKEEPVPIRELRPDVPDSMARILARMMAKDPSERYPSTQDLLDDLETLQLGKRKGPGLALTAVVLVAIIAAGAYLLTREDPDEGGGIPQDTLESNNGSEEASAYKEQVEDLTKEQFEKDALIEYLKIPEDASEEARLTQLQAIATRFPNTPTGEKASKEAEAIGEKIAKAREAEQARLAAIRTLIEKGTSGLEDDLSGERFGVAFVTIFHLGMKEGLDKEAEITVFKTESMNRIKKACIERCEALLKEADTFVNKQEFAAAHKKLDEGRTLFKPPLEDPGPDGKAFLEEMAARIAKKLAETARTERDYFLGLYKADLHAFLKALDPNQVRSQVLQYAFKAAAAPFESLEPTLNTGAYIGHTKKLQAGVEGAARLMDKLITAVEKQEILEETISVPDEDQRKAGTIADLTDDRDGIKILITQGGRSRLSNVPFPRFSTAKKFIQLLDGRFSMTGEDKLDLAEAALHFAVARCAAHLDPFQETIKAYDSNVGWTGDMVERAGVEPLLVDIGAEVNRLAGEAQGLDPSLAERSTALLNRLTEEEAAVEAFYASTLPFLKDEPGTDFEQAEILLQEYARNYSNTIFYWYILDLMGGSSRPDSHLVEFSR